MNLIDGKNVLIANTKEEYAMNILGLYREESLWNTLSFSSHQAIAQYSYGTIKEDVRTFLDNLSLGNFDKQNHA